MPKICYQNIKLGSQSRATIEQANAIIDEYKAQGYTLTLRQLYYQFVARGFIENKMSEYKRLGSIINDGRLAGLIDWFSIEDRTRNLSRLSWFSSPAEIVANCQYWYKEQLWRKQPYYVEVWIEKEALANVAERACEAHRIAYFCCRGYVSQSEMWSAGRRLKEKAFSQGKQCLIIHLGDHDPSGIDMTRDIADRIALFAEEQADSIQIDRIALNMDQVHQYNPPPNPAKLTDSRCQGYIAEYGEESWELDAIEPANLVSLISERVKAVLDPEAWNKALQHEDERKQELVWIADNYEAVKTMR